MNEKDLTNEFLTDSKVYVASLEKIDNPEVREQLRDRIGEAAGVNYDGTYYVKLKYHDGEYISAVPKEALEYVKEPPQDAPEPRFVEGDRVLVARAMQDTYPWVSSMDSTVGEEGVVSRVYAGGDVNVELDSGESWIYPSEALDNLSRGDKQPLEALDEIFAGLSEDSPSDKQPNSLSETLVEITRTFDNGAQIRAQGDIHGVLEAVWLAEQKFGKSS